MVVAVMVVAVMVVAVNGCGSEMVVSAAAEETLVSSMQPHSCSLQFYFTPVTRGSLNTATKAIL